MIVKFAVFTIDELHQGQPRITRTRVFPSLIDAQESLDNYNQFVGMVTLIEPVDLDHGHDPLDGFERHI